MGPLIDKLTDLLFQTFWYPYTIILVTGYLLFYGMRLYRVILEGILKNPGRVRSFEYSWWGVRIYFFEKREASGKEKEE